MNYMTRRSHEMRKHKFGGTYSGTLFVETAPVLPNHEKLCLEVSRPGFTGIYYVIRRSHQMPKHMFGVTCPDVLFMETAPDPPEHEK
jgi:hypothetical protein